MALGTIAGSLAAGAASAGVGFGLTKLFGGSKPAAPPPPTGINAGGLTSTMRGGNIGITPSAERLGLVGNIADTFGQLGSDIAALRPMVAPGISSLRASRLAEIEDARNRAIGDLRENLARRRVLGSSFGNDAIARAESEFGGARERVAAESTLQELELTNQLITQQFNANRGQFQTFLDELNLQADLAGKLAGKATDVMSQNARFTAALAAKEAEGAGKFFGQVSQPFISDLGKSVGSGVSNLVNFGSFAGSGFGGSGLPLAV
jgi:hypothetical protein